MLLVLAGCGPSLPDPDSAGAVVLRQRCSACHPVYAPGSMTFEMWKVKVADMRERFAQRGFPWLTADEERTLLDYLRSHAGTG